MSFSRFGRVILRGVSKFFGAKVQSSSHHAVQSVCFPPSVKASGKFLKTPLDAFQCNNFVAHARRKAARDFLQRNRERFALASFLGLYVAGNCEGDEEKKADITLLFKNYKHNKEQELSEVNHVDEYPTKIEDYHIVSRLGNPSSFGAVYHAKYQNKDVAIKMMFNHHVGPSSSRQDVILKTFKREYDLLDRGHFGADRMKKSMKAHPNIIRLETKFVDATAMMYDSLDSYPFYVPRQVDVRGVGCSTTLYLVMPKYTCSLREYLQQFSKKKEENEQEPMYFQQSVKKGENEPIYLQQSEKKEEKVPMHFQKKEEEKEEIPFKTRLYLICQLLEGVAFLEENNVAHRDLKSDNILVQTDHTAAGGGEFSPRLVITDFGSCFKGNGNMLLPFETEYVDKGGNPALMAPEIMDAIPGCGVNLNYEKSDVWAAGAISYEIFGEDNPLYSNIPPSFPLPLLKTDSLIVDIVVYNMMKANPLHRISARVAANVLCLSYYDVINSWFDWKNDADAQKWFLQKIISTKRELSNAKDTSKKVLFDTFTSRLSLNEITETLKFYKTITRKFLLENYVSQCDVDR